MKKIFTFYYDKATKSPIICTLSLLLFLLVSIWNAVKHNLTLLHPFSDTTENLALCGLILFSLLELYLLIYKLQRKHNTKR